MNRVLVIEDESALRETLSEILAINDYEVIKAADGEEGVEKALETLPDIIICDVNMPKMNGFEVLTSLSSVLIEDDLPPFIFLTAKIEQKNIRQGMSLGADDYITKPFNAEEILKAVKLRIEKRNKLQQNVLKSERERMSDELHNGIQSHIVAANMGLKSISKNTKTLSSKERDIIQKSTDILDKTLTETRNLSHHLVSTATEKKCIINLIDLLSVSEKIHFDYYFSFEQLKNKSLELTICSIIQEMITNSLKHSQANKIALSVTEDGDEITVFYSDNGIGFDSTNIVESEGLKGIRKKIEKLNGELNINTAVGQGVTIDFTIKNYA
tara:strand:- start:66 stop:1046 length:981 start_codon:yes stop_codon:yes gene_type:complete